VVGLDGDTTVRYANAYNSEKTPNNIIGLGSVVVFMTTSFALLNHTPSGYAALVIVQAGVFADASRQLVRSVFVSICFFVCRIH
jgi:hypothetical protein